ncbi:2-oxo acid dehydrogenase subunit E2 [Sandaracinobacteroides saxicola]|uniref:2-oxo acid dehydrogenase subunit E2 n=1 Tax=Sandaracinobacteroides saxicola TaxID=2759707 RepID=A0A7G5IFY6_9SPHN|nr:2-oxo acid dehydrogenase subunit E2 [Sandaracinobacteroides saxicola]QMW22278.1 2-oxo acid dehydrogenase subunit E2 [Sandaracinobacteroides saxicola]
MTQPLKLTGIRGMIAKKMHESVQSTAQLSFFTDVDASALTAARAAWKAADIRIGYEDLVIATLGRILPAFPLFNALEADGVITPQAEINVGVAIALPGALVAPAVFDCANKDLPTIAAERASLVERAAINKLTVREMSGGTINISNLGLTRVRHFTPILNRPMTCIVGLGRIAPEPAVVDGALAIRPVMGLSLTVDHRAIDGAPAGDFLTALADALEASHPIP